MGVLMNEEAIGKAVKEYNGWTNGTAWIWYDSSDGEVWTDVEPGSGTHLKYRSDTVYCIMVKTNYNARERHDKTDVEKIKKIIQDGIYKYDCDYSSMPSDVLHNYYV